MRNWRYELGKSGAELRALIDDSSEDIIVCYKIYDKLIECLSTLLLNLNPQDKDYCASTIEDMIEDIKVEIASLENVEYQEAEDSLNNILNDFYDLCDNMDVWVNF